MKREPVDRFSIHPQPEDGGRNIRDVAYLEAAISFGYGLLILGFTAMPERLIGAAVRWWIDVTSGVTYFGGDAGKGDAPDLVASSLPRHAQHRAFLRSGMADHDPQIAPVRDMRQRVGLLSRKDKAARFRTRHCRLPIRVLYLMAFPFGHEFGAVQALFGLDHLACGEAILVPSILAEFDQIGRMIDRANDFVELLNAIAMPVRELR